jgi:hypothetical protein
MIPRRSQTRAAARGATGTCPRPRRTGRAEAFRDPTARHGTTVRPDLGRAGRAIACLHDRPVIGTTRPSSGPTAVRHIFQEQGAMAFDMFTSMTDCGEPRR